jgi:predicted nucleic acid-binding protein
LYAQTSEDHSQECAHFLAALAIGSIHARLDPLVLHELSYILPRYIKQMSRSDVGDYLLMVLDWPGVHADKDLLKDVVDRWSKTPGLAFADAYLMALALDRNQPVFTKNVREFTRQGIDVPDPLSTDD